MRSDYHAEIIQGVLVIYDLNRGNKSVTNDIEQIIAEQPFTVPMLCIAQDSEGEWDEVRISSQGKFECFAYIGVDLVGLAIAVVKNRRQRG